MKVAGVIRGWAGRMRETGCIKIYVVKKTADLMARIPTTIEGYPVKIEGSGQFRARPDGSTPPLCGARPLSRELRSGNQVNAGTRSRATLAASHMNAA